MFSTGTVYGNSTLFQIITSFLNNSGEGEGRKAERREEGREMVKERSTHLNALPTNRQLHPFYISPPTITINTDHSSLPASLLPTHLHTHPSPPTLTPSPPPHPSPPTLTPSPPHPPITTSTDLNLLFLPLNFHFQLLHILTEFADL